LVVPGRKHGEIMIVGTPGGLSFGVLVAFLMSHWLKTDVSVICACLGRTLGWCVSCGFARRVSGTI
jgi:hypothetical protein